MLAAQLDTLGTAHVKPKPIAYPPRAVAARAASALRILVGVALFAFSAVAAAADPVALVTELSGAARYEGVVARKSPTVALLDDVPAGARLVVDRDASVVVSYTLLGTAYELKGPGRFEVDKDTVRALDAGRVAARTWAKSLQVARFAPGAAVQASIVTRGTEQGSALMAPKGRQLEARARTIRWRALGDDWRYRVLLVDADGEIVYAAETTQAEAQIPAHVELKRGRTYIWTVTGTGPGRARDEASGKFEIVDAETDRRYSEALAAQPLDISSQVILALSLEQNGLRQEAAHLWRSLAQASPQHPVLAQRANAMQRALAQPR